MNIINSEGEYEKIPGTQSLKKSNHPVYKARIDIALGVGTWVCAPTAGNNLGRFARARQTEEKVQEFQKEVAHCLKVYGPETVGVFTARGALTLDLKIAKDALNG
ncbi:hypothetical protein [Bdellovibrio bacteriovorus]|uniref:hypothetical protein n=1 Tax=Bdellovibrio bacteriovorus TaxID=959 RepID=UPI003AA91DC2